MIERMVPFQDGTPSVQVPERHGLSTYDLFLDPTAQQPLPSLSQVQVNDDKTGVVLMPKVHALRHAESVANACKVENPLDYYKFGWLDDSLSCNIGKGGLTLVASGTPRNKRLRDCLLTPMGVAETLERAAKDPFSCLDIGDTGRSSVEVPDPGVGKPSASRGLKRKRSISETGVQPTLGDPSKLLTSGSVLSHSMLDEAPTSSNSLRALVTVRPSIFPRDPQDDALILLVVISPLTRAILTACLRYHLHPMHKIIIKMEPLAAEVFYAPFDMTENIGRRPEEAFLDAREFLESLDNIPATVFTLLERIREAGCSQLAEDWWTVQNRPFNSISHDTVLDEFIQPRRVFEIGKENRRTKLVQAVKEHIRDAENVCLQRGTIDAVVVVCHSGVIRTLTGMKVKNLETIAIPNFQN